MEGSRFLPRGLNHEQYDQISGDSWTAVDLVERFGAIPLSRIVQNPAPGTATEQDVIDLDEHEDRLCELIDGTLVEKTVVLTILISHRFIGELRNLLYGSTTLASLWEKPE